MVLKHPNRLVLSLVLLAGFWRAESAYAIGCKYWLLDLVTANPSVSMTIDKSNAPLTGFPVKWLEEISTSDADIHPVEVFRSFEAGMQIVYTEHGSLRLGTEERNLDVRDTKSFAVLRTIGLSGSESPIASLTLNEKAALVVTVKTRLGHRAGDAGTPTVNFYVIEGEKFSHQQVTFPGSEEDISIGRLENGALVVQGSDSKKSYIVRFSN